MEKMKCPECRKRILDIDTKATVEIKIEAKCPHCKKWSWFVGSRKRRNTIHIENSGS